MKIATLRRAFPENFCTIHVHYYARTLIYAKKISSILDVMLDFHISSRQFLHISMISYCGLVGLRCHK